MQTPYRLAKISRIFGILSISVPLISSLFLFVLREDPGFYDNLILFIRFSGLIFGLPGLVLALLARRDMMAPQDEKLMALISTARTLNIIGLAISLLFLCTALNSGIAY